MRMNVLSILGSTLICSSVFLAAQTASPPASPLAACGDEKSTFNVNRGVVGSQESPVPGKALVFIIELADLHDRGKIGRPLIRQGLDGTWIGATQGFTYVSAIIDPGDHHLCSQWQSRLNMRSDQISLNNFEAVAGKTYYFRVQIGYEAGAEGGAPAMIDLQPVSADEGRLLVSQAAQGLSKPKN